LETPESVYACRWKGKRKVDMGKGGKQLGGSNVGGKREERRGERG
jgi:hypothetical protein